MSRVTICWSPLPIDSSRSFVFSPRSGRTYLLDTGAAEVGIIPRLLGLRPANRQRELLDPATAVLSTIASNAVDVGWFLSRIYQLVHRHRRIASTCRVLTMSRTVARLRTPLDLTLDDIGHVVQAVEERAGISDCYPRALITAYLCIRSRRDCAVAFGMLAPTPNLHAWCSSERVVPFEPDPPHWWYRPLAVIDIRS